MTITRTKDGVPGWNGDPATWLEFKQAARLYVASTKFEARYTCGPKIAAELTGAARTAIMGKKSSWLSEEQGTETLLQHLQKTIVEPALPEVGNFLRQYFKVLSRQKGESMTAFCVRHRDEYERMCRALARMMKEHKQEVRTSMPSSSQSAAAESVGEVNDGQGGQDDPMPAIRHQPEGPMAKLMVGSSVVLVWEQQLVLLTMEDTTIIIMGTTELVQSIRHPRSRRR